MESVRKRSKETMMANYSAASKWSDKSMEVNEEGLRTVECLRGRLLAERASSKAANDESELIAIKVTDLEKQLKMEIKSRNKAEKRLKFLMKKLDSLNISYVSADETSSSLSEKSEISSVSSSSTYQNQMELQKSQSSNTGELHNCPSHEENLGSFDEAISGNFSKNVSQKDENNGSRYSGTNNGIDNEGHALENHKVDNSMALVIVEEKKFTTPKNDKDYDNNFDDSMALVMVEEKTITTPKKDDDYDHNDNFDNSMALVVIDSVVKEEKQEEPMSSGDVKDVHDALRYARESLQASMEIRKHMKSNIAELRLNGISC